MGWNCQECGQPLQLDRTLEEADKHTLHIAQETVKEAFGLCSEVSSETRENRLNAFGLPSSVHRAIENQLKIATSTPQTGASPQDKQIVQDCLFRTLSTEPNSAHYPSTLRHPLCEDCTKQVLEKCTQEIEIARQERDALQKFERECTSVERESARMPKRRASFRKEIDETASSIQQTQTELLACDTEQKDLQQELDAVCQEAESFASTQAEFWTIFNQQTSEMQLMQSELSQGQTQAQVLTEMLNHLEQSNAYLDVFDIGQDDRGIATINGWHLGRLSTAHVSTAGEQIDWPEINAAWGQTAFLLTMLSRKLACQFTQYKIHPCGAFSTVERLGADHVTYELYGTKEWQIGRLFHSRRFDQAMVGVLDCAKQLCERASELDPALDLPYT